MLGSLLAVVGGNALGADGLLVVFVVACVVGNARESSARWVRSGVLDAWLCGVYE